MLSILLELEKAIILKFVLIVILDYFINLRTKIIDEKYVATVSNQLLLSEIENELVNIQKYIVRFVYDLGEY